jgi:hypothetical protein
VCGFPDATNTGLRGVGLTCAGLPAYTGGDFNTPNVVISGYRFTGGYTVTARNVTIQRSCWTDIGNFFGLYVVDTGSLTLQDSTIIVSPAMGGSTAVRGYNLTILRNDIAGGDQMVNFYGGATGTVKDNYFHDFADCCGNHNEAIYDGGSTNVTIQHNTMVNRITQTAVVYCVNDNGPEINTHIINNLLDGAGYTIYFASGGGGGGIIQNNRFARDIFPSGGYWGLLTGGSAFAGGGNVWDDNGASVGF